MKRLLPFLVFLLLLPHFSVGAVVINEVMSSNEDTIADEDGDFQDWIELYNDGAAAVDLSGWGLSDNPSKPFKWSFPAGSIIGAGEYLVVWASGKDRMVPYDAVSTVIPANASWRYAEGAEPPEEWVEADFDDSGWALGSGSFGYGDNFSPEVVLTEGTPGMQLSGVFTVDDPSDVSGLELELAGNPGVVVYVNGEEAGRDLMPAGAITPQTRALELPAEGLALWLSSDRGLTTRTQNGQQFVSRWGDQSGNGFDLVQNTAGYQPRLVEDAINGRPTLDFDGISQRMATAAFATGDEMTIFVVTKPVGGSDYSRVFAKGSAVAGITLSRAGPGVNAVHSSLRVDTSERGNQLKTLPNLYDAQWHHVSITTSRESVAAWVDDQLAFDAPYQWGDGIQNSQPFVVGAAYAGSGAPFEGQIAEVILYNRKLSESEIAQVDTQLDLKYGRSAVPATRKIALDGSTLHAGENSIALDIRAQEGADDLFAQVKILLKKARITAHTGYSISGSGEDIVLSNPDGALVDSASAAALRSGISYGRKSDDSGEWGFLWSLLLMEKIPHLPIWELLILQPIPERADFIPRDLIWL